MNSLVRDIGLVKSRMTENASLEQFDFIYSFTNENIKDAFALFDLKDKEVLSVLASSDQIIDMFLRGAKNIDTFDLNGLTKYYFYLKKAALLANISKEEFLAFFCGRNNKDSFSKVTFEKIKKFITDKDSLLFWSYIFSRNNPNYIKNNYLFSKDEWPKSVLEKAIFYLDDENYAMASKKAESMEIKFHPLNFVNLKDSIEKKFDFIYLSNIMQYADSMYEVDEKVLRKKQVLALERFKEDILKLDVLLKENGEIVNYIYDATRDYKKRGIDLRAEVFKDSCFEEKRFVSIQEIVDKYLMGFTDKIRDDACLVYHK